MAFEWEDTEFEDEGAAHPVDTIFDRDREVQGRDW